MKHYTYLAIALAATMAAQSPAIAAEVNAERQQIAVLVSSASQQDKEAACARLRRIGSLDSVPVLTMLLTDDALCNAARNALEVIEGPEVCAAFIKTLDKATVLQKIGILNSLGNRGEAESVDALTKWVANADTGVATAAASALGKVGTPKALKALKAALPGRDVAIHAALVDALLTGADRRLEAGDLSEARAFFDLLNKTEKDDYRRTAAFAGFLRASGADALKPLVAALAGSNPAKHVAALQVARELKNTNATKAFTELLPKVSPLMQAALLEVLRHRGDASAAPDVLALVRSQDTNVCVAAITALGGLGDHSVIPTLVEFANSKDAETRKAARQSLLEIRGKDVDETIVTQMTTANPANQAELARALAGRGSKSTVPKLLDMARSEAPGSRSAALRALPLLAGPEHLGALVQLVKNTKTDDSRSEVQEVVRSVCLRFQSDKAFDLSPVLDGVAAGETESRIALLEICSGLTGDRVRETLRAAIREANPVIQAAARRTVCESQDPGLLPDILAIAKDATEPNVRTVALRAYAQIAGGDESSKLPSQKRVALIDQGLAVAQRIEEKRLLFAALAAVPARESLDRVMLSLDSGELQPEAALAAIQISKAIQKQQPELVRTAMTKVVAVSKDSNRRTEAAAILAGLDPK